MSKSIIRKYFYRDFPSPTPRPPPSTSHLSSSLYLVRVLSRGEIKSISEASSRILFAEHSLYLRLKLWFFSISMRREWMFCGGRRKVAVLLPPLRCGQTQKIYRNIMDCLLMRKAIAIIIRGVLVCVCVLFIRHTKEKHRNPHELKLSSAPTENSQAYAKYHHRHHRLN